MSLWARSLIVLLCLTTLHGQEPQSRDALGSNGRIPVLLISGADTFHDWRRTTPQLRTLLESAGRFDVRIVEDAHILESRVALAQYRALFFNQQVPNSTPAMRRNLKNYLKEGGGLVALHWAVDNFHDWPGFADVLGRGWEEGVSGEEHGKFDVHIVDRQHPITRGVTDFATADDEAIHFRLRGKSEIHVLATVRTKEKGEEVPVMFTHAVGKGRVFFSPFGHSANSRNNPGVSQMIVRATEWAATGNVKE